MPARPAPLPPGLRDGPFLSREAIRRGISAERLRRSDLTAPLHGVRTLASEDPGETFETMVRAAMLVLRSDQHLSHVTAALVWGCPVPRRFREAAMTTLHVTTAGEGPVERRRGIAGHRARADRIEVITSRGLRTSSPATFWYECRTLLSVRSLVVLGDHLVGRSGLSEREWLEATIHRGDRAVTRARTALELVRPGAESPMETIVRIIVVEAGFPEPTLNVEVSGADGTFIGRVDLAWPDLKIAIEYDGDHHRTDRETFHRDRGRSNDFSVAQWLVIHVTAVDVRAPSTFLDRLRQAFVLRTR